MEFFLPSQPGMAPPLLLLANDIAEAVAESVIKRCPMLIPVISKASPSSAVSESLAAREADGDGGAMRALESGASMSLPPARHALLLLAMALRHASASASLLQRSSSSRSTVRTLMQ